MPPSPLPHGVNRHGADLRDHAGLFDPLAGHPDGVTGDPVEFAIAAFTVATPATGHADRERKAEATITSGLRGGAAKPRRRHGAP